MAIIDAHTHIGTLGPFDLTPELLLGGMRELGIERAVVSDLEGAEFDGEQKLIPGQKKQMTVNEKTLALLKKNPMLKGLFWIKPRTEGFSEPIERFMVENREFFAGFKVHPFHSRTALDEETCRPYLECAERHGFMVVVHTATDRYSGMRSVFEAAKRHPKVDFVLAHLGLATDQREAIALIKELPNLYGDTSWVDWQNVVQAVRACGSERILFGTDAPIDQEHSLPRYRNDLERLKEHLSEQEARALLWENAARLFWKNESALP